LRRKSSGENFLNDLPSTIHHLGTILGQVISELESPAIFAAEEKIRALAKARRGGDANTAPQLAAEISKLTPAAARAIASAFTVYFDLANLAEEAERVHALRERERAMYPTPNSETIAEAIAFLKFDGVSSERVQQLVRDLSIELVITAHPTEAKRRTILSKLARIAEILRLIDETNPLPHEREEYDAAIAAEITELWLTSRTRTQRPQVTDEVRTGLYYVQNIFWDLFPKIYADLDAALAKHYPEVKSSPHWLTLASWIGGDRDGNPNVTAAVTAETLRLHRGLAVEKHHAAFQDLARRLTLSAQQFPLPQNVRDWIDARRPFPARSAYLEQRYADEPYRVALSLLADDLQAASQVDMTARLMEVEPTTARVTVADLSEPLDLIGRALPPRLASDSLSTVRRQLAIFGLHAARLDVREDSSRLNATLDEMLRALGLHSEFEKLEELARSRVLARFIEDYPKHPVALRKISGLSAESAETWELFRLIARARLIYGTELFGPFIISMTRAPSDVLAVQFLASLAGCADGMQIVPLFETLDDLDNAPRVLSQLFAMEIYRAHLKNFGDEQMVMIGYSDSNKDGGYLAANWALYQAQENIASICAEHGIQLTLFHGRGGTTARGGGPAHRAIRAQPPGTINGRFRLTEQGEVIASRYSNPALAHRHLEQIVSAVLLASAPKSEEEIVRPEWRAAMTRMAFAARNAYRDLVHETPGFIDYWRAVTPIDEIPHLMFGSRPVSRQRGDLDVSKTLAPHASAGVRAIPWVFSWIQSRYNLPSWYGLGAGLESEPDAALLKEMDAGWQFFRALLDNAEMALLKADLGIAALYSELDPNKTRAKNIFTRIEREYDRTRRAILGVSGHAELMDADPVLQKSVQLRNPYVDPLNYLQIEMLRRLRVGSDRETKEAQALQQVFDLTINGIASGLRNTG